MDYSAIKQKEKASLHVPCRGCRDGPRMRHEERQAIQLPSAKCRHPLKLSTFLQDDSPCSCDYYTIFFGRSFAKTLCSFPLNDSFIQGLSEPKQPMLALTNKPHQPRGYTAHSRSMSNPTIAPNLPNRQTNAQTISAMMPPPTLTAERTEQSRSKAKWILGIGFGLR